VLIDVDSADPPTVTEARPSGPRRSTTVTVPDAISAGDCGDPVRCQCLASRYERAVGDESGETLDLG
jgi:hypothetical protein